MGKSREGGSTDRAERLGKGARTRSGRKTRGPQQSFILVHIAPLQKILRKEVGLVEMK